MRLLLAQKHKCAQRVHGPSRFETGAQSLNDVTIRSVRIIHELTYMSSRLVPEWWSCDADTPSRL
jgi:hypothetical protein